MRLARKRIPWGRACSQLHPLRLDTCRRGTADTNRLDRDREPEVSESVELLASEPLSLALFSCHLLALLSCHLLALVLSFLLAS